LLSLGNRFVRDVKRASSLEVSRYSGGVRVHFHDRVALSSQLVAGVVLVVLLGTLGTFQYRWLGDVSEAERTRMRDSLRTRATEFTQEFDRELTRIYLAFHLDSDAFEREPATTLTDALARAKTAAAVPGLVKAVFLIEARGPHAGVLQQLDASGRALQPVEWPPALERWRRRAESVASAVPGMPSPIFMADAVDATTPALLIRMSRIKRIENGGHVAVMPDPVGSARAVVVWLDAERLQRQLLEPLVAKYFGSGDKSAYLVSVVRRDEPSHVVYASATGAAIDERSADVTTGLFDLRMDEVTRLTGENLPWRVPAAGPERVAITIVRRANGPDDARVLMTGENQGAWQVRVRHRSGSLEAIVAQSRRRNLAISLGVVGLLGASFLLVIAAAQRQRRLAQQQMAFVAGVSHELRTPLAVICSAGENLADGLVLDAPQIKKYGAVIETEGRRLGDMVERVMQYAGISSGAPIRARSDVDVAQVIAAAVSGVSADALDRGITVTVQPNGTLPLVTGDVDALRCAVQNIVANAVKYSPNGAAVDITTHAQDGIVQIRVADRGLGIDAADLPHIFKPFYRGRRAVDAQVRGTGVGLSVVKHVLDAHHATIAVDSRVGEGTTVTMELLPAVLHTLQPRLGPSGSAD